MIHLRKVEFKRSRSQHYPFNIPLIKNLKEIEFRTPVTILVGENGSGKSTILEGIAASIELPTIGSYEISKDTTLVSAKSFSDKIKLVWNIPVHRGFFLRAEDFFGFIKNLKELNEELVEQKLDYENRFEGYAKLLTVGSTQANINELQRRYSQDADAFSHGESFLNLFQKRIVPKGLYILDEPEVPLSPKKQLSLISLIKDSIAKNCQFIIATHSPILLAFPGATIYSIEEDKIIERNYGDLEHVTLTRDFLNSPESFLKHL